MKKIYMVMAFCTLATTGALANEKGHRGNGRMSEEVRQAMDACLTENNLEKPERGTRPTDEQRKMIDACLKAKGIEMPQHPEHHEASDGE